MLLFAFFAVTKKEKKACDSKEGGDKARPKQKVMVALLSSLSTLQQKKKKGLR